MPHESSTNTELKPVSQPRIDRLLSGIERLQKQLAELNRPAWARLLNGLPECVRHEIVTVCYAGHQKTGKSTLVNGATRRSMLSVDEFPDTGVITRLVAGKQDKAIAMTNGHAQKIECTSAAIRAVTALQPGVKRRADTELADELRLELTGTPIPPAVCWLDPPGADDTPEMTKRSKTAAAMSDVLIYVTASRQPLSDGECDYIAEHIAQRGPASVVVAVNAFLKQDDPTGWSDFQSRWLPFLEERIAERHEDLGFTNELGLAWYPVSARALAAGDGDLLGGAEFRRMLLGINSPSHPRVQRTRLFVASRRLDELSAKIGECRQTVKQRVDGNERRWKKEDDDSKQAAERFRCDVNEAVGNCLTDFSRRIQSVGTSVRANVSATQSGVSLSKCCEHDRDWNRRVQEAAEAVFGTLANAISAAVKRSGQLPLTAAAATQLRNRMKAPEISIMGYRDDLEQVGNEAAGGVVAAGAAGTFALGLMTGGIGWLIGAGGTAVAASSAKEKAIQTAAADAQSKMRADIDQKTRTAANGILGQRDALVKCVLEQCGCPVIGSRKDVVGREELNTLAELLAESEQLAEAARTLAMN
ncbi:MAG: dynamin family protein [Planctomycetaceae bacterium]